MTKPQIIEMFTKIASARIRLEFARTSQNYFYKYMSAEDVFQFFVVRHMREQGFKVVVNNKEGRKSRGEQYKFKFMGNLAGVSDLQVSKHGKVTYLELKAGFDKVFTKKGKIKAGDTLARQAAFLEEMEAEGHRGFFMFPENYQEIINLIK